MPLNRKTHAIRRHLLKQILYSPVGVVKNTAARFGLTRQAVSRHLRGLIEEGYVKAVGNTRDRKYQLLWKESLSREYKLENLQEHQVWEDDIRPALGGISENIQEIWAYGATEMINNAIDHSEGTRVSVKLFDQPVAWAFVIEDDGVGIFRKIQKACGLEDERHAILELAKGKLTTDPENHTGEGIFFTSRCFDRFDIFSGSVDFNHLADGLDESWVFKIQSPVKGTQVVMILEKEATRTVNEIFDRFAESDDDYAFSKTVVPVNLVRHGKENLISRSQAKRLMSRVDQFRTVVLDFKGIDSIGQAFSDEIFRVFVLRHPEIQVIPTNSGVGVRRMIRRARARIKTPEERA